MLSVKEILTLSDKGFTPEQIMILNGEAEQQKQEETPAQEEKPAVNDSAITGLRTDIQNLIKTMQESNLANAHYDGNKSVDIDAQTDAIMSGIIRPIEKGEKE